MALRTSVEQAANNALAAWLTTQLASVDDGVSIEPRWPDPDKTLPEKAISIITAGPRQLEFCDPKPLGPGVLSSGNLYTYQWHYAEVVQPIQLDVWCQYDVQRDDLVARLDDALNSGAAGLGQTNIDPVSGDLILALSSADGWGNSNANFVFGSCQLTDTADNAQQAIYRATYRGEAQVSMSVLSTVAQLTKVIFELRASITGVPAATGPFIQFSTDN